MLPFLLSKLLNLFCLCKVKNLQPLRGVKIDLELISLEFIEPFTQIKYLQYRARLPTSAASDVSDHILAHCSVHQPPRVSVLKTI